MSEPHLIIGRRKIDVQNPENTSDRVRLGDQLPKHYMDILDQLPANIPNRFINEATRVGYFMTALDQGVPLYDQNGNDLSEEVEQFARTLAEAPFIDQLFYSIKPIQNPSNRNTGQEIKRRSVSLGNPGTSLPNWLLNSRAMLEETSPDNATNLRSFYNSWVEGTAISSRKEKNGTYSDYPEHMSPQKITSPIHQFKAYVEVDANQEALEEVFSRMTKEKIHPHETKITPENRLVMYWSTAPKESLCNSIREVFYELGVAFRGFDQDSEAFVTKGREVVRKTVKSNDQAMGEDGQAVDMHQDEFNNGEFFKRYLSQCYRWWRNPMNPRLMSFVPFFKTDGQQELPERISDMMDLVVEAGLEVVEIENNGLNRSLDLGI